MKRKRNTSVYNYDNAFDLTDTRFYGVFLCGKDSNGFTRVKIDPVRYAKMDEASAISDDALKIINARKSHYFYVKKTRQEDYYGWHINQLIEGVKSNWEEQYKMLYDTYDRAFIPPEKPEEPNFVSPGNDYKLMCGISSFSAAEARTNFINLILKDEYNAKLAEYNDYKEHGKKIVIPTDILIQLYSQFILATTSQLEAFTIRVVSENGYTGEKFFRNSLYAYYNGRTKKDLKSLPHFTDYDKLYSLWNFLKHNTIDTYNTIKKTFPEILIESEFRQGNLAYKYVKFNKKKIFELLDGCKEFFFELFDEAFDERPGEYLWNYTDYFYNEAIKDRIKFEDNPLGLDIFDDID